MWDQQEHLDPAKAASAIAKKLGCGATTFPIVYAEQGLDAEVEISRQAAFLGMDVAEFKQRLADQLFSDSLSIAQQSSTPPNESSAVAWIENARVEGYLTDEQYDAIMESIP